MGDDYLLKIPEEVVSLIRNLHPIIKADMRSALHKSGDTILINVVPTLISIVSPDLRI